MAKDIKEYCSSCVPFTAAQPEPCRPHAPLTVTSQKTKSWQEIAIDLKGPLGTKPTPRGNRYVLVTIDFVTRAAELVPIPNKTAETVANALVKEIFFRQGILEPFLTDRGSEFDNQGLTTLAEELRIDKKRASPLHPQANGSVERFNRTVSEMSRKSANELGDDWDL